MAPDIKPRSRAVTDGLERAAARGMPRAVGMDDDDFSKPQIGVASSWNEITPCNLSLDRLAKAVKNGVHAGGGYPLEFGTISVSDGISMGHEGDRKSTRLNSSHVAISYAVFCLKKKDVRIGRRNGVAFSDTPTETRTHGADCWSDMESE